MVLLFVFLIAVFPSFAQESIADLIVRIKPSVVKIQVYNEDKKLISTGSGFFISQTKAITNKHVIDGGKFIELKMFNGTSIYASKIEDIGNIDISVLEFKSEGIAVKPLSMATESPREGDRIIVFGNPRGLEGSVSDGLVSATRTIDKNLYMQITAPISPGSSGSPVLDSSGRVVGIATLNIKGGQNLNFAIPVKEISSIWVNQVSKDFSITNKLPKQIVITSTKTDLTGNWKSLMTNEPYQIINGGDKVSLTVYWKEQAKDTDFDAKWVGDLVIGRHSNDWYFVIRIIDSERIGLWRVGTLKPTDSDEKILKKLTQKSKGKPEEILKRVQ